MIKVYFNGLTISIHALVKRATGDPLVTAFYEIISIHALVKRATSFKFFASDGVGYFNPRPREEGDQLKTIRQPFGAISIHALVKRATKEVK